MLAYVSKQFFEEVKCVVNQENFVVSALIQQCFSRKKIYSFLYLVEDVPNYIRK